tara:strand:- start:371 stop:616 length:246 start_codon:yes stop_codon:yes gene_type:complete
LLNDRIGAADSRLTQLIQAGRHPMDIVKTFYQHALNRQPNERELAFLGTLFHSAKPSEEQQKLLEDFVWGVVTCQEFGTNH